MSGSQRYGADGEGVAPEDSHFKARLHAVEQQAESRIVFLYLLPSFLDHCERPYRQEKNPVLGRVFLSESDVVQHYFPQCLQGFSPARAFMSFGQFFKAFQGLKGRLLGFALRTIGRQVLEKAFVNSVKAIEARNSTARAAGAS